MFTQVWPQGLTRWLCGVPDAFLAHGGGGEGDASVRAWAASTGPASWGRSLHVVFQQDWEAHAENEHHHLCWELFWQHQHAHTTAQCSNCCFWLSEIRTKVEKSARGKKCFFNQWFYISLLLMHFHLQYSSGLLVDHPSFGKLHEQQQARLRLWLQITKSWSCEY